MKQSTLWRLILPIFLATTSLVSVSTAAQQPSRPIGFANDIQRFLTEDKVSPPPQQAILFIGSSIFRQWADLKTVIEKAWKEVSSK